MCGELQMPAMGELAQVRQLHMGERSLGKFRLQVHRERLGLGREQDRHARPGRADELRQREEEIPAGGARKKSSRPGRPAGSAPDEGGKLSGGAASRSGWNRGASWAMKSLWPKN